MPGERPKHPPVKRGAEDGDDVWEIVFSLLERKKTEHQDVLTKQKKSLPPLTMKLVPKPSTGDLAEMGFDELREKLVESEEKRCGLEKEFAALENEVMAATNKIQSAEAKVVEAQAQAKRADEEAQKAKGELA
ncbi:hypothetical protein LTS18_012773 [Coniosporium uncinatum]|uniref:Uncharacterized protein n=1 Tax=Coniosporium uncinatum TaxID=93489 RepID=A0ACC3DVM8_9PEZI|nr:hypothetical protein LTS18_012773 [Coniosporium uncinatum]